MSGVRGDFRKLDEMLVKLEQLGEHAGEIAAPALAEVARAQWAAGQGPSGATWDKTKDGRTALVALTSQITIVGRGTKITMRGSSVLDFHVRRRRAMPSVGALPSAWRAAIERALQERLKDLA